ncbi:M3 family metallopeptidase [Candidatus Dependentiae bacterium]
MTIREDLFREDVLISGVDDLAKFFPKTIEDIRAYSSRAVESAQTALKEIIELTGERNFENTALALDEAARRFSATSRRFYLIEMVHPNGNVRDVAREEYVKLSAFAVDAFASRDLYKAFRKYSDKALAGNAEKLSDEEKYFLEKQIQEFELLGLQLPEIDFKKVQEDRKRLTELSSQFSRNIAVSTAKIKIPFTKAELEGVSEEMIESLKRNDEGKYFVGVDYPTFKEVMAHCTVESTRKEIATAFVNRAHPENDDLLSRIAAIRDQMSQRLGFYSYPEKDLSDQMAKNPKTVEAFIEGLLNGVAKKAEKEKEDYLKDLPKGVLLNKKEKLKAWDVNFVKNEFNKKQFNVDDRKIAEYLPLEHTLKKIFEIYQKFLGLKFVVMPDAWVWHEDVKLIEIRDVNSGNLHGYIYLDLYPRPFKYTHACFMPVVSPVDRVVGGEKVSYPSISAIIANFPRGTRDNPALLKHIDVTTFFHEFGHAMHGLLGRTNLAEFSGTSVLRDFVETPSQMFEEWMWQKEGLKFVTRHYKTGEPMPDALIDSLIEMRTSDTAFWTQRQSVLSLFSLRCFGRRRHLKFSNLYRDLYESNVTLSSVNRKEHFHSSFGHLTGYGAKYYSYLWTKVYALDLFDFVKNNGGILSGEGKGALMVRKLLAAGGSVPPEKLLKEALGREPSQEAFFKAFGI